MIHGGQGRLWFFDQGNPDLDGSERAAERVFLWRPAIDAVDAAAGATYNDASAAIAFQSRRRVMVWPRF